MNPVSLLATTAALAVRRLLHANPNHVAGLPLPDSLSAQFSFEKTLLFSAGLDMAYVCGGGWPRARAAGPAALKPERLLGYGRALWAQGGSLFLFDVGFYLLYRRYAEVLLQLL